MLCCLMFLLVSPLAADCSSADKKALEAYDRSWGDSATKGDRAALEQIYAVDFMGLTSGNMLNRADTIDGQVRDADKARGTLQPVVTHDYYMINCTATTATITHRNVITTTEDGHSSTNYSRSIHVLEKRDGRWQVVTSTGNPIGDAAQVIYLEHDWNDADMSGNSVWFDKNYASNMTNISSRTGKMTNKAEEMADLKSRKSVMTSEELSDLDARKEGDTVVVTGINHVKGKDGEGKAFDTRVAFTDVWIKRDNRWQVLASQGTSIR
jgi:ketosteroid isomerase-like protein